jgi:hypothetical protein
MFGTSRKRLVVRLSVLTMAAALALILATMAAAKSPIVHRVHVGGPDACAAFGLSPGCDANFTLTAIEYADGSVSGQFTDQWGGGLGGLSCRHRLPLCRRQRGIGQWRGYQWLWCR